MIKKIFYIFIFLLFTSCSGVEFVYEEKKNLINPLYEKTLVNTSGVDLVFLNSYIPMYFGENKYNDFSLSINIEELPFYTTRCKATNQIFFEIYKNKKYW